MSEVADPQGSFSRRGLLWGIPVIAISLLATLISMVLGPEIFDPVVNTPSAYSRSAIGHQAFAELLESLDYSVEVSRSRSGEKAREEGLLIIAEPEPTLSEEGMSFEFLRDLRAARTLLVLPKRDGAGFGREISSHSLVSEIRVEDILDELIEWRGDTRGWEITRSSRAKDWRGEGEFRPQIDDLQVVRHPQLEPLLENDDGVLIGRLEGFGGREITLISHPDLIANHSLWPNDAANAKVAVEWIERLAPPGEPIIIDETCHQLATKTGFWREMFRFPAIIILAQFALLFGAVLWHSLGRFGAPQLEVIGLEAGSRRLVDSTAELLHFSRRRSPALRSYLRLAIDEACRLLSGPKAGSLAARAEWLAERERSDLTEGIESISRRVGRLGDSVSPDSLRELALAIDRWRWEIVHGSERDRSSR